MRRTVYVLASSAVLIMVSACSPGLEEGYYSCTSDDTCPSGWFCRADNRCYSTPGGTMDSGTDTATDTSIDVPTDTPSDTPTDTPADVCVPETDKVDVLMVVDNSNSMTEEQASLATAIPQLVLGAVGMTDLHLGFISTDMGTGGITVPTCTDPADGDDGILRTTSAGAGCSRTYPRFLESADAAGAAAISGDIACMSVVGTGGCGFEQQFEAALKSVTPSDSSIDFFTGTGHGDGVNDGFVRDDSVLVVVFVTDEEDCSWTNPDLVNPSSRIYTENLNLRCHFHPEVIHPITRYVDGLLDLRDPRRLVVMGLVGVPVAIETMSLEEILLDPVMDEQVDAAGTGIVPSCNTAQGVAFPPRRFVELASELDDRGVATVIRSICQDNYSPAIIALRDAITGQLLGDCP